MALQTFKANPRGKPFHELQSRGEFGASSLPSVSPSVSLLLERAGIKILVHVEEIQLGKIANRMFSGSLLTPD